MTNGASRLLKQIIANLSSMAKSKTMALKSKTNAIKARLIIFSLVKNKKFLMRSITGKFHSVLGHSSSNQHNKHDCLLEDGGNNDQSKAIVLYNNNAQSYYEALQNPSEESHQVVEEQDQDGGCYESYYNYGNDDGVDDDDKYPDLTHSLFDSEDLDLAGSVIDLVKNSKEEAGQEFKLEDEIDLAADLFILKFKRQILLQKQESLKRKREMLQKGA